MQNTKIDSKITLANGEEVSIGDKVALDNGKTLIVRAFLFKALVGNSLSGGDYTISGVNVEGIEISSGDYQGYDKSKVLAVVEAGYEDL